MTARRRTAPTRHQPARLLVALVAAAACLPALAGAQAAPQVSSAKPAPPATAATDVKPAAPVPVPPAEATVTVVGSRTSNRVDRQVYDVRSDNGASNDTVADALNKVPSVVVDPDGTVTLRGKQNVQILIDGKPAAMLQGEGRGAALNALPAEDIASIEVINTPGAQFGNEGGGGPILNLVTRRTRRAGGFATVNANAGTGGRYNASVSGSANTGGLSFQGSAHTRHDGRNSRAFTTRTRIDPATGVASYSTQSSASEGLNDSNGVSGSLNWNLGDRDKIAANASWSRNGNNQRGHDRYVNFGADQVADSDYERSAIRSGANRNQSFGARWERKGGARGEVFEADLRVSSTQRDNDSAFASTYALRPPGTPDTRNRQAGATGNRLADFSGDYERPGDTGVLKLGYKISGNRNSFDTRYAAVDPLTLAETVNPMRTNRFGMEEKNLALYGSYELRASERWGFQGGLRAEHTRLDIDQVTSGLRAANSYTSYIPSFFVNYKVSNDTDLRLSYARRIDRPDAHDLNPFVVYRDEFNAASGNPHLTPAATDTLELGLETRIGKVDTNLRAYYFHDSDLISERRYFISETVLLTTRDNGGSSQSGGLEFTLGGKLLPYLTINTSGNLAYMEQSNWDDRLGGEARRSATSLTGRARFNFQLSKQDSLQLTLTAQGKSLSGQGYRRPGSTANINYRRSLTPALSLTVNVNDVFDRSGAETVTDTALLKETSVRRFDSRVLYIGLSYRLGGFAPARRPGGPSPKGTVP